MAMRHRARAAACRKSEGGKEGEEAYSCSAWKRALSPPGIVAS